MNSMKPHVEHRKKYIPFLYSRELVKSPVENHWSQRFLDTNHVKVDVHHNVVRSSDGRTNKRYAVCRKKYFNSQKCQPNLTDQELT